MDAREVLYHEHEYDLLNWNGLIIQLDNDEDLHLSSTPTKNIELGIEKSPLVLAISTKLIFTILTTNEIYSTRA